MKKVIISGADGFVGSYTVREFLKNGYRVIGICRGGALKHLQEEENLQIVSCNVFQPEELLAGIPADEYEAFLHFAWAGSAGPARADYRLQMDNAVGTVECMKAAQKLGCRKFVCAGSIMEYEVEAAVHTQGSRPGMNYIYGMGKHIAHCLCKSVAADIGMDLFWPMITNAYGAGEYSPRFVNTTLRKILGGEPLQFTSATQNYDFVYVTDVAKAFYLITTRGKPFCEYMIGSGEARPLREFILEMQQALAPDAVPIFGDVPFTGTNMPLETFGIEDLEKDTGFRPEVRFAEGTRLTMDWLKTLEETI